MKFSRIDLSKTSYNLLNYAQQMSLYERDSRTEYLKKLYKKYCIHKQFKSVMPLFDSVLLDRTIDIVGYYPDDKLVAFSLIKKYDNESVESLQFAWDYENPTLRLGIESLKHECAYYKNHGFKYLYLGLADDYKSQIDGYEILGPM